MAHSNQIREFIISSSGIELRDVYTGEQGVLTGSARLSQEAKERAAKVAREEETQRKHKELERKRAAMDAQIAALQAQFESERDGVMREISIEEAREQTLTADRDAMSRSRQADLAKQAKAGSGSGNGDRTAAASSRKRK
jgi:circadian clock protein KaiC